MATSRKKPLAQKAVAKKSVKPVKATVQKSTKSKALEKPVVIEQSVKNDRAVEIRGNVNITAVTVAQLQRAMLLQSMAKNKDKSSLKFYLGPSSSTAYRLQDQAALADTMTLISTPVDVIIRSAVDSDGLKAFLSATGKRFMFAGARLYMGVVTSSSPYAKNKDSQVRRQLFNDYYMDLLTLVRLRSGETDRAKIYRNLLSAKGLSALEALSYGKKGLIDGILIGADRVITRADLDAFLKAKKWTPAKIREFIKHYINVYQVLSRPLKTVSPTSIPAGTSSYFVSLKKPEPPLAADKDNKGDDDKKSKGKAKPEKKPQEDPKSPVIYHDDKKIDPYPMLVRASKDKAPKRMMIDSPVAERAGILDDDAIFFNDGFREETAEQIGDGLVALDHKKIKEKSLSHIKILENSPGGSVWSGQELRSLIKTLVTPVDVIVYGMGASCGSWLLCSATGNRLATPQARIMFHEAANSLTTQTAHDHYNEVLDGLDQATLDYIAIVAQSTGRPFDEVLMDFDRDVWLNPIEALFYGPKGLLDGVLVSADKVITRADVEKYLIQKLGTPAKVKKYVTQKILEKRDPRQGMEWRPEDWNPDDPFDNPLVTITEVAKKMARPMREIPKFKRSLPDPKTRQTIDYYNVVVAD